MRIAYCCADPGVPIFGSKGASLHAQGVLGALASHGHEIDLFATRLGGDPPPALASIAVHLLPAVPRGDVGARERAALRANDALNYALAAARPFDLVYERYSLWSFAAMERARSLGIPGVLEVNAPLVEEQARHRTLVDRKAADAVADRVFAAASLLVAVSDGVAAYLRGRIELPDKVEVVPNGVDPDRFQMSPPPRQDRRFTVGFLGTLKAWHGLRVLVEAFSSLARDDSRARLLVVGDGPERPWLERDLAARGLSARARLAGAVAPAEVPALLAEMDVGVAPYPQLPDFYFSPLKVVEYMAAGVPVVASRLGEIDHLLSHGQAGLLCPPGDHEALSAALRRLRDDAPLRHQLAAAGRRTALAERTWNTIVDRILALADASPTPAPAVAGT